MNLIEKCKQFLATQRKNLIDTDQLLKDKYNQNPFYPFTQVEPYKFEYSYSFKNQSLFYVFLSIFLFVAMNALIKLFTEDVFRGRPSVLYIFLFIISLISTCYFFFAAIISYKNRYLVLNLLENDYKFYFNRILVHENSLENLFIELKQKYPVKNKALYCLIIYGKHIDQIEITGYNQNLKSLRKIGKSIAANLTINYIDFANLNDNKNNLRNFLSNNNKSLYVQRKDRYWMKPNVYSDLRNELFYK